MKRGFFLLSLFGIFFFTVIAIIASQVDFPLIPPSSSVVHQKFYDYAGITHVHSIHSTGSGTYDDIIRAASLSRCHFVIFTDLNPTKQPEDLEGYRRDVLVVWGGEYGYLAGHILVYNWPEKEAFKGLGQAQLIFDDLLQQTARDSRSGFLVAAHPFHSQRPWENLEAPGLAGIEVINLDSMWQQAFDQSKASVLWSFFILPFNSDLAYLRLFRMPDKELEAWDRISAKHSFVGFAGSDATANAIPIPDKSFKFPSYARSFSLAKNHVLLRSELTGSYESDRRKIMEALGRGSFYFSLDLIGDPAGFSFYAVQEHEETLLGHTLSLKKGDITLVADLGRDISLPFEIVLTKNGRYVSHTNARRLEVRVTEKGAYRVTVRVIPTLPIPDGKTWFPWIFSNAIRVE